MLLVVVSLPIATKLVQQNQDNRSSAAIDSTYSKACSSYTNANECSKANCYWETQLKVCTGAIPTPKPITPTLTPTPTPEPRRQITYYGFGDSETTAWENGVATEFFPQYLYQDPGTYVYYADPTGETLATPGVYLTTVGIDRDSSAYTYV